MTTDIELPELAQQLADRAGAGRIVIAIAGAPGSGKSMIAERLASLINATTPDMAAILPMDGYHFDDHLLAALRRLERKGAPDTFDVDGFRHMLARLRENSEPAVAVPVFDRDIEIARAGARLIRDTARIIVAEGNYLLLNAEPWQKLRPLFDVTVFVQVDEATLRARLEERWRGYGLDQEQIRAKVEDNDIPNGRLVFKGSCEPDYRVRT